jgi:hypothetical protein
MTIDQALNQFYLQHGFAPETGERPRWVGVFAGCLLVPLPNIDARRIFLKFHDLHHILTGADVTRIGEGEVSAWELGTGTYRRPVLMVMNLIALSTGVILAPGRMYRSFLRGCRSANLYSDDMRRRIETGGELDLSTIEREVLDRQARVFLQPLRGLEFLLYVAMALVIHVALVAPSLTLRGITRVLHRRGPVRKINTGRF